ncbi:MAG: hypothetical protein DDT25_00005 [Chloroflexi bacterium]|nr:hypothetical protein [Chloroflexota bacterium]
MCIGIYGPSRNRPCRKPVERNLAFDGASFLTNCRRFPGDTPTNQQSNAGCSATRRNHESVEFNRHCRKDETPCSH